MSELSLSTKVRKIEAYDEKAIKVHLLDVDKIRARPVMYLGNEPIFQMLKEGVDNGIDEFSQTEQGSKKWNIYIKHEKINKLHTFTVADRGRGIPVGMHEVAKMPTITAVLTMLQAGGKFDAKSYAAGRGTHGTGIAAANAVSKQFEVWTYREDDWYYQRFEFGKPVTKVIKKSPPDKMFSKNKCGTVIKYTVDNTIQQIAHDEFKLSKVKSWLNITSMVDSPIRILFEYVIKDQTKSIEYFKPNGALEYLKMKLEEHNLEVLGKKPFTFVSKFGTVVCQWASTEENLFDGYTNGIFNPDGGTHLDGFYRAIVKAYNSCVKSKKRELTVADLRAGLVGLINVRLPEAEYGDQTKNKLKSPIAKEVDEILTPKLAEWFSKHKSMVRQIFDRADALRRAREQSKKIFKAATAIKDNRKGAVLPGILTACDPKCSPNDREIFFVEGDSAAGGCKEARDKFYQQIFKMKGKAIPNIAKKDKASALSSPVIQTLLAGIGVDPKAFKVNSNPTFTVGRIIALCFTGDTLVPMLDGTRKTLKELAKEFSRTGEDQWLYSIDLDTNKVVPTLATDFRKTKQVTKVAVITLNNGYKIRCTLDHLVMVNPVNIKDKRIKWNKGLPYIEAQDLIPSDSIRSAYLTTDTPQYEGYLSLIEGSFKSNETNTHVVHKWVLKHTNKSLYKKYKKDKFHIHHIDHNQLNNLPTNIELKTKSEHAEHHSEDFNYLRDEYNQSGIHGEKISKLHKEGHYGTQPSEQMTAYNSSKKHKKDVSKAWTDGKYDPEIQVLGKYIKFIAALHQKGLEIKESIWNKYQTSGGMQLLFDKTKVEQALVRISNTVSILEIDAYKLVKRKESNKRNYPTQSLTKFVVACKEVLENCGSLDEEVYSQYRKEVFIGERRQRGTPTWKFGLEVSDLKGKSLSKILRFIDTYNHQISSVKIISSKEQMYCLTVKGNKNFGIYSGPSIFTGRKKRDLEENITKNCEGMIFVKNCDPDPDGFHILNLWLTALYLLVPQAFEQGLVYIVDSPLFVASAKNKKVFGYSLKEIQKLAPKGAILTRLKGWAEATVEELEEIAFNKETRKLLKVKPISEKDGVQFMAIVGNDVSERKRILGVVESV